MDKPITLEAVQLVGFRAYLQPHIVHLCRGNAPLSLAVFAPNAKGKSSLVDAFEFYFSDDATLNRLGIQAAERYAGRAALEHVDAQAKGVTPAIQVSFRQGTDRFGDSRAVTQQGTPLPAAARRVRANYALPFVIRGCELRGFVERQTPEERYEEIIAWFGLQPLLTIQKNLRALRKQVKQRAESTTERQERLRDLARITGNTMKEWDEANVCNWLNHEVIWKLDNTLTLAVLSATDTGYRELKRRKAVADETLGIASLKRFLTQLEALGQQPSDEGENAAGAIVAFENSVTTYNTAASKEVEERGRASQTVFSSVWEAAKTIFENKEIPLDACPVCDTQFSATPHGSRDAIQLDLTTKLSDLAAYRDAQTAQTTAAQTLSQSRSFLVGYLETLTSNLKGTSYPDKIKSVEAYQQALATWKTGNDAPDSTAVIAEMKALHTEIFAEKNRIEAQQGEHTYGNACCTSMIMSPFVLDRNVP
jgi:hypothetical protein